MRDRRPSESRKPPENPYFKFPTLGYADKLYVLDRIHKDGYINGVLRDPFDDDLLTQEDHIACYKHPLDPLINSLVKISIRPNWSANK